MREKRDTRDPASLVMVSDGGKGWELRGSVPREGKGRPGGMAGDAGRRAAGTHPYRAL